MSTWAERQFGPVVLEDRLVYKREIRLLEFFTVDVQLAGATADIRRFKIRNRFFKDGATLCASVDSIGLWLGFVDRKPIRPPDDLRDAWLSLECTEDFADWG